MKGAADDCHCDFHDCELLILDTFVCEFIIAQLHRNEGTRRITSAGRGAVSVVDKQE
jgi:hypothetical protein